MLSYIRVRLGLCPQARRCGSLAFRPAVLHDRRLRSLHRFLVVQPANARFCDAREAEKGVTE